MTFYEHAMLGGSLALALGAHRRQGWGLAATAAGAGALPDWDGLSLLFGPMAYSEVHRTWGHNLLAAGVGGLVCGAAGYLCRLTSRVRTPLTAAPTPLVSGRALAVWVVVSILAAESHLPADLVYGGAAGMPDWPLKMLWPFSQRGWAYPVVPWGDLGATAIFIVEMFALYRWPTRARLIAALSLLAVAAYVAFRWALR
jgi:hypothetical protein